MEDGRTATLAAIEHALARSGLAAHFSASVGIGNAQLFETRRSSHEFSYDVSAD